MIFTLVATFFLIVRNSIELIMILNIKGRIYENFIQKKKNRLLIRKNKIKFTQNKALMIDFFNIMFKCLISIEDILIIHYMRIVDHRGPKIQKKIVQF